METTRDTRATRAGRIPLEVAKTELRWFFSEAEGDLGLRAASLEPGLGGESCPFERAHKRIGAASRWADVASRLRCLSSLDKRVLLVAYTPHRWPGLETWYELAGVAALLAADDERRRTEALYTRAAPSLATLEWSILDLVRVATVIATWTARHPALEMDVAEEIERRRHLARLPREQRARLRARTESIAEAGRRIVRFPTAQATTLRDRSQRALGLALKAYTEIPNAR